MHLAATDVRPLQTVGKGEVEPMLYAALTFWLLAIVFLAWGVHSLWGALVKPKVVNAVLLPGTLVAQLGHILGVLITGNSVQNATLMQDDDTGNPAAETPEKQRLPVIGQLVVGLLPLLACTAALYCITRLWGAGVLGELPTSHEVARRLPTSLDAVWDLLHSLIALAESLLTAILRTDLTNWTAVFFLYLAVCLTVRMTPFEGNRRGAIGAILLAGVLIGVLSTLAPSVSAVVETSWPILSFAVAMLVFLLLISLVITGLVALIRVLVRE